MILAAGLGTRLKPWTDRHPKALAIVNGKPLLQRNVEYLQRFGITDVVVNIHHFADQIREAVKEQNGWGSKIVFSDETDHVLETGGGILRAQNLLIGDGNFAVMNVDILTDLDLCKMISFHQQHAAIATLAITDRHSSRHLLFDEEDNLAGWENTVSGEKKIARPAVKYFPKAFSGIHIIKDGLLAQIKQQGKFSIIDTYLDLAKSLVIKGFDHSGGKLLDVGKPANLHQAESLFL